jgi:hypothetical protein
MSPQHHMPSHTTYQNLNCACQLACSLFLCKFLRVKSQKLAKTLSKIHTAPSHEQSTLRFAFYENLERSTCTGRPGPAILAFDFAIHGHWLNQFLVII